MVIARPNVPPPPAGYVKQKREECRLEAAPKQAEMTRQEEYSYYPPDSCPSLCRPCDAACCCCMNCLFEAPVGIACAAGCSPGGLFCCTPVSLICDAVIKCACCCGDPNERLWDFLTRVMPPSLIHHGPARYLPYFTMYTGVLAAGRCWYPLTANPSWPAVTPWVYTYNKLATEEWFEWTRGARMPERAADGGRLPPPEKVKALFDRGDPESENAAPWARCLEVAGVTGPGVPPTGDSPPLWPAGPAPQNPRTNVLAMWAVNFFIASWFQSGVLTDGEHYTRNFSGDFDMGYVYGQTKEQQAFLMNKEDGTVRVNSSGRPLRYMDADNGPFSPESRETLKFGKLEANVWASGSNHTNVHVGMYFMLACAQSVHNVLAVEIRKMHPEFDGPRIFDCTKQLVTFLFFQVVRREYVGFLNGGTVGEVNAQVAALNVPLNRYSPMVAGLNVAKHLKGGLFTGASAGLEYETSYMWHAMPPEELGPLGSYSEKWIAKPGNWTDAATGPTLRELLHAAQVAPSSLQTLGNTPSYLLNFEMKVVERSRRQRVGSFNQVRAAIHLPPITSFDQFAAPWDAKLAAVYEHPDDIDLYVGYNAPVKGEYDPERSFMTQSMLRIVSTLVFTIAMQEQDCLRKVPRDVWARFKDMDLYSICATAIAADPASIAQPGPNQPLPPASYSDQGVTMFYPVHA